MSEAASILGKEGISLTHFPFEHREIRSDDLGEVATEAVQEASRRCGGAPVFVEDSGLFIDSLNGFPGTYSAWVQKKIGNAGILSLMDGRNERGAVFRACIAYHDGKTVSIHPGECRGAISEGARGGSGFGYDPIFVPEGHPQTFAENIQLKNILSHRYNALLEFSKSLASKR